MSLVVVEIDCALDSPKYERFLQTLPLATQNRAARYLVSQPRHSLVASQVALRACLRALGFAPEEVTTCERGRPYLPGRGLEFNLSHSHQRAVLLLSRAPQAEGALGVDLEWIGRSVERDALARRYFTPDESRFCHGDPERFFFLWTRKEAVLKSNGVGLRVPLDSFEVLSETVEQKVTGRSLALSTVSREGGYTVSWAVDQNLRRRKVTWVEAHSTDWLARTVEGIES